MRTVDKFKPFGPPGEILISASITSIRIWNYTLVLFVVELPPCQPIKALADNVYERCHLLWKLLWRPFIVPVTGLLLFIAPAARSLTALFGLKHLSELPCYHSASRGWGVKFLAD